MEQKLVFDILFEKKKLLFSNLLLRVSRLFIPNKNPIFFIYSSFAILLELLWHIRTWTQRNMVSRVEPQTAGHSGRSPLAPEKNIIATVSYPKCLIYTVGVFWMPSASCWTLKNSDVPRKVFKIIVHKPKLLTNSF